MRAPRTIVILAIAASLPAGLAFGAEQPSPDHLADMLSAWPGVAITHGEEGGQSYTEWRKNKVFYRLEGQDAKSRWIGDDESGNGAVMCSWMIFVLLQDALHDCSVDRFAELRTDLDRDVPAIERFIVENSVIPVTFTELRSQAAGKVARQQGNGPTPEKRTCPAKGMSEMVEAFDAMGRRGRRDMVDRLLSVPRWPVSNPCL